MSRDALIAEGLPIVKRLASFTVARMPPSVDVRDLVGAGCVGLLKAADVYDPTKGPFTAYATVRIRGHIIDWCRLHDPLSRHHRIAAGKAAAAVRDLTAELGHPPQDDEVATRAEMPLHLYRALLIVPRVGPPLFELVDPMGMDPETAYLAAERRRMITAAVHTLPSRTMAIFRMCYAEGMTLRAIAAEIGVTEARVSQIRSAALETLRAEMRNRHGDDESV